MLHLGKSANVQHMLRSFRQTQSRSVVVGRHSHYGMAALTRVRACSLGVRKESKLLLQVPLAAWKDLNQTGVISAKQPKYSSKPSAGVGRPR